MDRNIPDVRDIFGRYSKDSSPQKQQKQELRSYEYSPRSRRRHEGVENSFESRAPPPGNKKTSRSRSEDHPDATRGNAKRVEDNPRAAPTTTTHAKSKESSRYSTKTLTERDIRHLERHLSMKKTIRKQISRNLAQAFVDDPELVFKDATNTKKPTAPDRTFTLTRAKVSKSEHNVLDLLKDNEPDSGHCSADNPNSSDDDSHELKQRSHRSGKTHGNSRDTPARTGNADSNTHSNKDEGKFSFWKMFSVKNRGRR